MANWTKWTPQKREKFLAKLRETANVTLAARYAGISRSRVYQIRNEDREFVREWHEAIEEAVDLLEAEARRRAMQGVSKPVFYQGKKCGIVQEYSDTLIIFLLKAHRPEKYADLQKRVVEGQLKHRHDHNVSPELNNILAAIRTREPGG